MLVLTIFGTVILLSVFLLVPEIIGVLKTLLSLRNLPEERSKEKLTQKAKQWADSRSGLYPPLSELVKIKPVFTHHIWLLLRIVGVVFHLPIFILRVAMGIRFGNRLWWRMPFSLYHLWDLIFIALSFYYATNKLFTFSVILAVIVGVSGIYLIGSDFEKKEGRLKILSRPEHKLSLSGIITDCAIVLLSFAPIYYALDKLDQESFSKNLSIFDSIYYSIMTGTTVGCGDIIPISLTAKAVSMLEVAFGIAFFVIIIGVFVTVWLNRQTGSSSPQKDMEKSNDNNKG